MLIYSTGASTPIVSINGPSVVNANEPLRLQGAVLASAAVVTSWSSSAASLDLTSAGVVSTPPASSNLVVNANRLSAGQTYTFTLTANDVVHGVSGFASLTVYVNKPPAGGACTASPSRGFALNTSFAIRFWRTRLRQA